MGETDLAKKLRLYNAKRALILNAPDDYVELLGELPEGLGVARELGEGYDFAHLFVRDREELEEHIGAVLGAIKQDAILWISYPKGGSGVETDLNRDKLWEALSERGIRPVAQVSIDEVWSAMRFRPYEKVGK
jgi:hypothetical protein